MKFKKNYFLNKPDLNKPYLTNPYLTNLLQNLMNFLRYNVNKYPNQIPIQIDKILTLFN